MNNDLAQAAQTAYDYLEALLDGYAADEEIPQDLLIAYGCLSAALLCAEPTPSLDPAPSVSSPVQSSDGPQDGSSAVPTPRTYRKSIDYDPATHDFAMYLDSELVGFARTYQEAEITLDQLVFELLSGQYVREAA